jgi:hypothetical protein
VTDTSRRDFLRAFGRRAARDAREVAGPVVRATEALSGAAALSSLAGPARDLESGSMGEPEAGSAGGLEALVDAEGLDARLEQVRALARASVSMRPVVGDPASAAAWLDLVGAEELLEPGAPMMLLAQVALSDAALAGTWLHRDGWLVVFVDGAGAASVVRLEEPASLSPTVEAMALEADLALPDVDDPPVQALGLSDDERAAYIRVSDALVGDADHVLLGFADTPAEGLGDGDWQLLLEVRVCPTKHVAVWVADRDLERAVAIVG